MVVLCMSGFEPSVAYMISILIVVGIIVSFSAFEAKRKPKLKKLLVLGLVLSLSVVGFYTQKEFLKKPDVYLTRE